MKNRPDQKLEQALDRALADIFPASNPVASLQPTAVGLWLAAREPQPMGSATSKSAGASKETGRRATGLF